MESLPEPSALRELLLHGRGVLALPGGGCARYVFSEDVNFRRADDERLRVRVERGNASYRELVHRSGMNLHLVVRRNPDQTEALLLVLHGHLVDLETGAESEFQVTSAYLEEESGRRTPLALADLGLGDSIENRLP
jgi:hypothetical protein